MQTYFCYSKAQRAIKIGKSTDPNRRLLDHRVACPDVVIIGTMNGDLERHFHDVFKEYRISREWFRAEGELAQFVRLSFGYRLPYKKRDIGRPVHDSLVFAVEEICERSESAIATNRNREEFVQKYTDLLDREYPECERPDDGSECDCYLCEELARFYEHCWEIEELWDQVFGFLFRKDGSYFRLVIVFWMPSGQRAKSSLLNHCADLQYSIDERTELFSVQIFFVTKSGRVMDSEELFWELNPDKKVEYDRYQNFCNNMTEEWLSKYNRMRMDYVFGFLDEMQPKTDPLKVDEQPALAESSTSDKID